MNASLPLATSNWLRVLAGLLLLVGGAFDALASGASSLGGAQIFASGFELSDLNDRGERLPREGSELPADSLPQIGLRLLSGGVDPTGWRLILDGVDISDQATTSVEGILYTPQEPLFEGRHDVEVRHASAVWRWHFLTKTLPQIEVIGPQGLIPDESLRPEIGVDYLDIGSGLDISSARLMINQVDVTSDSVITASGIRYTPNADLVAGRQTAFSEVTDLAGNRSEEWWFFYVGPSPSVRFISPSDDLLPFAAKPEIVAEFDLESGAVDVSGVDFYLNDLKVSSSAVIKMTSPRTGTVTYQSPESLASGGYTLHLGMKSEVGVFGWTKHYFKVDVERIYRLDLLSPAEGDVVDEPMVNVVVGADSTSGSPRAVYIGGERHQLSGYNGSRYAYSRPVPLRPGLNTIHVKTEYPDGVERELSFEVRYDAAPEVEITTPSDWSSYGPVSGGDAVPTPGGSRDLTGSVQRPVTVTGTTSTPVVSVQINQQQAQLGPDGQSFTFPNYFLHEGTNLLSAVATDAHGRTGNTQITVYVDQTAPLLTVESPTSETVTSLRRIDVRGIINDAVEARVGAPQPRVMVRNAANGAEVESVVSNLGYLAQDVPLEVGLNRLTVSAIDEHGNTRQRTVDVVRTSVGGARLVALSGNRQSGPADQWLPEPLSIQAFHADGQPWAGLPIRFDIQRGSGSVGSDNRPGQGNAVEPARNMVVVTDGDGVASVDLRLGVDARPGSDVVRAWTPDVAEEVVFTASVVPGAPHRVYLYGSSGNQYVATETPPVEALMAQVLDAHHDPVEGATVEFRVLSGDARFTEHSAQVGVVGDEGRTITVESDRNGVATVRPLAGHTPGDVRIHAEALLEGGGRVGGASFHLMVVERQDGPTRLSGVVLDHTGVPLAGVRLSIARTMLSVVSDDEGHFEFASQVPPGKVDLFVDGRDVRFIRDGREHEYPALHFETAVIQGQLNQLPHAIYLPPVDLGQAVIAGGDEDVMLTLPGFEGLSMRVRANSVTFPDGSRVGPLVLSPVHNDRLPMVPPGAAAQFETVGWTLQPTNTRFDPPIEVTIPNTSGMKPGQTIPIMQWDHDLAAFVPMGNGTVSEDGTRVVSDPGSGLTKAGWGGGGPPPPPDNTGCGPVPECAECERLIQDANGCSHCARDSSMDDQPCGDSQCKACRSGHCVQKHEETPPDEAQEVKFNSKRIRDVTPEAMGSFIGYPMDREPDVKWEADLSAYCNAEDGWRFKVVEFKISTVLKATPEFQESGFYNNLTNGFLDSIEDEPGPPLITTCQVTNRLERSFVALSSTHFREVTPNNPVLEAMKYPEFPGFTPFTRGHPGFYRVDGIWAHEEEHYRRFREVVVDAYAGYPSPWGIFKRELDEARLSVIQSDQSSQDALDRFDSKLNVLINAWQREAMQRGEDFYGRRNHDSPSQFFRCAMMQPAIRSDLDAINAARRRLGCAERPVVNYICPGDADGT